MKKFVLKTLDVILTIIMIVSVIYSIFNLVMSFLPVEIQNLVFTWLHMSGEYIATFSISAAVNAAVLIATKLAQTYSRIKLTAKLTQAEQINSNAVAMNEKVVDRTNIAINNLNVLVGLIDALLAVQKITTERNIKASDKLVHKSDKEEYKKALETIENARKQLEELKNITTVYEKTEIKEVIVEKEKEELSGRV